MAKCKHCAGKGFVRLKNPISYELEKRTCPICINGVIPEIPTPPKPDKGIRGVLERVKCD